MSANELVARIECFGDEPAQWNKYVNFYERNHSFHRLVAPEGINFVDYLELPDEFYLANKYISEIHQSLTTGVAVVAMQKKQDQNYAFGGEMTLQKPRLVINLDNNDPHGFTCKIAKLKEPKDFTNKIQGKVLDYHITRDTQLVAHSGWRFVNKSQRQAINIEYDQQIIKAIMPQ